MELRRIMITQAEQLSQPIPNAILTLPTFASDETTLRKRLQACQTAGWNAILCDTIAHLVLGKQLGLELHYGTEEEGDRDGQEYRQNNGKCLIRIQQVSQLQSPVGMGYFNQSKCNSTS